MPLLIQNLSTMQMLIAIDANVLVALTDKRDKWHRHAVLLRDALVAAGAELVYFDCVVNETISVIGRRAEEQRRSDFEGIDAVLRRGPASA